MNHLWLVVFLIGSSIPFAASAETLTLQELLSSSGQALSVKRAELDFESANDELDRERGEKGWRVSAAAGYGTIRNIVDVNRAISYQATQGQIGLTYPLLGAEEQEARKIDLASGKAEEKRGLLNDQGRVVRLEIEANYALYWGAQEALRIVSSYLSTETLLILRLQSRVRSKVMLQSDLLTVQAGFEQARSDQIRLKRIQDEALDRLARLSGRLLQPFDAQSVTLTATLPLSKEKLIQDNSDLLALSAHHKALAAQLDDSTWYGLEAGLDLTGTVVDDTASHQAGGTGYVGLHVSAPLSLISVNQAEKRRLTAELESTNLEYEQRSHEIQTKAKSAEEENAQSLQDLDIAVQRTKAAGQSLHEHYLRSGTFASEGYDVIAKSLHEYYILALAETDARVKAWQANVDARRYGPLNVNADYGAASDTEHLGVQLAEPISRIAEILAPTGVTPPAKAVPSSLQLDDPKKGAITDLPAEYNTLRVAAQIPMQLHSTIVDPIAHGSQGFSDKGGASTSSSHMITADDSQARLEPVSVKFTVATDQISPSKASAGSNNEVRSDSKGMAIYVWKSQDLLSDLQNTDKFWSGLSKLAISRLLLSLDARQISEATSNPFNLAAFIKKAHQHNVHVELLLGDPTWIEAEHQAELVALIESLRHFNFDGLSLDEEPDQIFKQPLSQSQFDNWIASLRAAAQVSPWPVSISMHPRYFRDEPYSQWRLGQLLKDAGLREVILMIYSSNPSQVANVAGPIISSSPGLMFSVAQSVEPELKKNLSYAGETPADFEKAMNTLQGQLGKYPNTRGVVIQEWSDYLRIGYESEIR